MANKCILLSAFNDLWKSPGPYLVEQYWVTISRFTIADVKGLL
jgi:exo-beta-1,3-glucanase (GH17 family)